MEARRRFLLLLAVPLAPGLAACAARSEPPPDPDDGSEPSPGPGPDPEPPPDPRPEPECMSNDDVKDLVTSGEGDAAIIARLTSSETCFDVSSAAMLDLRNAGVSPRVIQAMTAAARREEH